MQLPFTLLDTVLSFFPSCLSAFLTFPVPLLLGLQFVALSGSILKPLKMALLIVLFSFWAAAVKRISSSVRRREEKTYIRLSKG